MAESPRDEKPACYGDIETVFPLAADGLRATPEECMRCLHKTACLRSAMEGRRGWRVRAEMVDRAYRGGIIGFFQRWSRKKIIDQQRQKEETS
ncbi:hypothetical protein [Desulfatitalea alkaliphila]|uniref:4Fe-4S Wbl-type domain-containing protein n=1 Tax=Desulfatitalea alkaliphila TaxID=2929485 RepID=A0AA41UIH1_9BACT|nr:hypothetical protein [Desulfatitalea alkaliphila]MCJ8500775.1 hypothetical protein [Desulfatitalea alkaliphila]